MSVLIKGFEKPDHCLRCPMKGIDDECVLQGVEVCDEYEDWKQQMANCPLVPVPPHGRLIDADALYREIKAECNPYGNPSIGYDDGLKVLGIIGSTPPVIPAEDGE